MELHWIEGVAASLLEGLDVERPPSARELVRARLPGARLVPVPGLVGADAMLGRLDGVQIVAYRRGLHEHALRWAVAHEVVEAELERLRYHDPDRELVAEALTAAVLAPRALFARRLREHGRRFPVLAKLFLTSQTCVALRVGEVTGQPVAVVAPHAVRVRGEEWGWPETGVLRGLASTRRLPPELQRARLTDDRARAALVAKSA